MKRAVVVLLLLIANAIVSSREIKPPPPPAEPARPDYSLGLFTVVDGASLAKRSHPACPATDNLVWSRDAGDETSDCRTGEDSNASSFDVRL
jgi:hypothetical protein